jgi:hypothetical protein
MPVVDPCSDERKPSGKGGEHETKIESDFLMGWIACPSKRRNV